MVTAVYPSEGAIAICEREECGRDFCCCPEPSTTILQSTHKKSPRATIESSKDAALSLESFNNGKLELNGRRQDDLGAVGVAVSSSKVNVASSFESDIPSHELQRQTSSASATDVFLSSTATATAAEQTPTADRYPTMAPFQEEGDADVASSTLSETINGSPIVPSGKARPDSTPSSKAISGLPSTQNLPELSPRSSSSSTIESSEFETTSKDAALLSLKRISIGKHEVDGTRKADVIGARPTSTVDVVSSSVVNVASSSETRTESCFTSDGELSRGKKREVDGSVRNEPQAHPIFDVVVSSACGRFIGDEMFYRHEPTHDKRCRCLQCRPGAVALPEVHILAKPIVGKVLEAFPDWTYDVEVPRLEGGYITVPWQCLLFGSHSNKSSLKWEISGIAVIESVPLGTSVSPAELEELLTDTSSAVTSSRGDFIQSPYSEFDADESVALDATFAKKQRVDLAPSSDNSLAFDAMEATPASEHNTSDWNPLTVIEPEVETPCDSSSVASDDYTLFSSHSNGFSSHSNGNRLILLDRIVPKKKNVDAPAQGHSLIGMMEATQSAIVFVRNVPYAATVEQLDDFISEKGLNALKSEIDTHKDGKSKGYAFLTMSSFIDATRACELMNGLVFLGRELQVMMSDKNNTNIPLSMSLRVSDSNSDELICDEEMIPSSFSSASGLHQAITPSDDFWLRPIKSIDQSLENLSKLVEATLHCVNRGMTLSLSDNLSQRVIHIGLMRYLKARHPLLHDECSDLGLYELLRLFQLNPLNEAGTYSISISKTIALCKSGFAKNLSARPKQQLPPHVDANDHVGVFTRTNQTLELAASNPELGDALDFIRTHSPVTKSFRTISDSSIVTMCDEATVGSCFPGDVRLVAEMHLYPGSDLLRQLMVRPRKGAHDLLAEALHGTEGTRTCFTWIRALSCLHNGINDLPVGGSTHSMIHAMFNVPNGTYAFQQQFTVFELLLSNPEIADEFVNVCPRNILHERIKKCAIEFRQTVMAMIDDGDGGEEEIRRVVVEGLQFLEEYDMTGSELYEFEMKVCGDPKRVAEGTARVLPKMVKEVEDSRKKSLIIIEYKHYNSLKDHEMQLYSCYFSEKMHVGDFVRADGGVAGKLFRISLYVNIAVTNSFHLINSPKTEVKTALRMYANLLTVKSVLGEANLQVEKDVAKVHENAKAFALQLEFSHIELGNSKYFAIRNNSADDLFFGNPQKQGLQALINWISNNASLSGCHVVPFGLFALHIGYDCLKEVMKILGCKHEFSDISVLMQTLKKEQGDLGKMSKEHRDKISKGNKGKVKVLTQEHRDKLSKANKGNKKLTEANKRVPGSVRQINRVLGRVRELTAAGLDYKLFEYECKKCKENVDYNQMQHIVACDYSTNQMSATCPCCRQEVGSIRKSTKYFTRLGEVTVDQLQERRRKMYESLREIL